MHVWELCHSWNLKQIAQSLAFSSGSWPVLKGSYLFCVRSWKPICRMYKHGTFLNTVFTWTISVTCFLLYHFSLLPLAQFNWFLPFSLEPTSPLPLPSKTNQPTNPNILNHPWLCRGLILQRKMWEADITVDSRLEVYLQVSSNSREWLMASQLCMPLAMLSVYTYTQMYKIERWTSVQAAKRSALYLLFGQHSCAALVFSAPSQRLWLCYRPCIGSVC